MAYVMKLNLAWPGIAGVALLAPMALPAAALAQTAVVQPVPPRQAAELNDALRRLASRPRDLDALIDAGNASLLLDDVDAAIGFFGRADELSPNNPRVKLGLAAAFVHSGKPLDAFPLFDQAQAAGGASGMLAAERGLAFDLVGDPRRAQEEYARALAFNRDDEIIRRLAVSQAIAGDRRKFEATLRPLITRRDFAAYRARAFGLAILGRTDEALAISDAVMPRELSTALAPYLRYMPQLTSAQQAAAANLGIFPRAAQIGRDDPQLAQYRNANSNPAVRTADARLAPSGPTLGSSARAGSAPERTDSRSQRRRPGSGSRTAVPRTRAELERASRRAASDPMARTQQTRVAIAAPTPAPTPTPTPVPTPAPAPEVVQPQPAQAIATVSRPVTQELPTSVAAMVPATGLAPAPSSAPVHVTTSTPVAQSVTVPEPVQIVSTAPAQNTSTQTLPPAPEPRPSISLAQTVTPPNSQDTGSPSSFDLADFPPATAATRPAVSPSVAASSSPAPPQPAEPAAELASVADAFEGFSLPPGPVARAASDAVDITAIRPPREIEAEPATAPAAPAHPSRIWVQIATGRDRSALRFDWRRLKRKVPNVLSDGRGPFVVEWGQANRLLAGPFASQSEARKAVAELKQAGVDSFTYASPDGQEIAPLK